MLTVNDAGGTHNTQVTTSKNDLIHKLKVHLGRIYFDTCHVIKQARPKDVGIPTSDNPKLCHPTHDG